jgi:hypothetical protein
VKKRRTKKHRARWAIRTVLEYPAAIKELQALDILGPGASRVEDVLSFVRDLLDQCSNKQLADLGLKRKEATLWLARIRLL